jgi:CRISPR/Cas system endoribonuclease Cas6 (RAMP superfamily)
MKPQPERKGIRIEPYTTDAENAPKPPTKYHYAGMGNLSWWGFQFGERVKFEIHVNYHGEGFTFKRLELAKGGRAGVAFWSETEVTQKSFDESFAVACGTWTGPRTIED